MDFEVVYVGDDELAGKDWAIVRAGAKFYAFIKRSCVSARVLTEMWVAFAGFRGLEADIPRPRWEVAPNSWRCEVGAFAV